MKLFSRISLLLPLTAAIATHLTAALPTVQPVDFSKISPADFADEDLALIPNLAHLHTVANAIVEEGPNKGFINISVWRHGKDNQPYNARIMENVLTLTWFYTAKRTWNPYYGDAALRARIEAALDFIARSQNSDGQFSEYGVQRWNLAATGFMTKFLGETLQLLDQSAKDGGPTIDPAVLKRAEQAQRKALIVLFSDENLYRHAKRFSNQFGNGWPGALAWLHMHPQDKEVRDLFLHRFRTSKEDLQSSAGFYHEHNGPDFGYTLGTHATNSRGAWPFIKGTQLEATFVAKESDWFDFLIYSMVPQPGTNWYAVNRAVETRQSRPVVYPQLTPLGEVIPAVRAFSITQEEREESLREERANWERNWPNVPRLRTGAFSSFSPYDVYSHHLPGYYPTNAEREAAIAQLPQIAKNNFNHLRHDTRSNASFLYLRRPAYYTAFTFNDRPRPQQRYGIGLLWSPENGVLLQAQSNAKGMSDKKNQAWGTRAAGMDYPFEAEGFPAQIAINGRAVATDRLADVIDLPNGDLRLSYALTNSTSKASGSKTVTFTEQGISSEVLLKGNFTEEFPLALTSKDEVKVQGNEIAVIREGNEKPLLVINWQTEGAAAQPKLTDYDSPLPGMRTVQVAIPAHNKLSYNVIIH